MPDVGTYENRNMYLTRKYKLRDSVNVENRTMDVIMPSDIYIERRYSLKGRMIRVFFIVLRYARCRMRKIRVTV